MGRGGFLLVAHASAATPILAPARGAVLWEVKLARDGGVLEVGKSDADGN
jgi:hypothetical protein